MNVHKINFGFWDKPFNVVRWAKDTKMAAGRLFYTLRHGYPPQATWETYAWFTDVMKSILTEYNKIRHGYPFNKSNDIWGLEIEEVIELLNLMDEANPIYDDLPLEKIWESQEEAKNRFMDWFKENFFDLWD